MLQSALKDATLLIIRAENWFWKYLGAQHTSPLFFAQTFELISCNMLCCYYLHLIGSTSNDFYFLWPWCIELDYLSKGPTKSIIIDTLPHWKVLVPTIDGQCHAPSGKSTLVQVLDIQPVSGLVEVPTPCHLQGCVSRLLLVKDLCKFSDPYALLGVIRGANALGIDCRTESHVCKGGLDAIHVGRVGGP